MSSCYMYQGTGKKVGSTTTNLILIAAVGLGGLWVYNKFFADGGSGTAANNATIDQNTATTVQNDINQATQQGNKQTISDSTLSSIANQIFYLVANDGAPSAIVNQAAQVNTYMDWLRLVQLYGTRKFNSGSWYTLCALTGFGCDSVDLGTTLKTALPPDYLSNLNTYFSDQGIPVIL